MIDAETTDSGRVTMQQYEYKVMPAPTRAEKVRGLKTGADRFAHTLAGLMNAQAREGWEYVRADTLPTEERTGLTGRATVYHTVLVFRRPAGAADPAARQSLTVAPPLGDAPRLILGQEGTAPRLGSATD